MGRKPKLVGLDTESNDVESEVSTGVITDRQEQVSVSKTVVKDLHMPLLHDKYTLYLSGANKEVRPITNRIIEDKQVKSLTIRVGASVLLDTGIKSCDFISYTEDLSLRLESRIISKSFIKDDHIFILLENHSIKVHTITETKVIGQIEVKSYE